MERVQTSLTEGIKPWVFLDRIITSIEYIKKKDVIHSALARETFWDLIVVDEAHYVAESGTPRNPYATARTRLGLELREACYGLILLTATPHNGHRHSFRSLLELVEPTDATFEGDRDVVRRRISRNMIRRLKPQIFKTGPDGSRIPAFPPREPVRQIPVDNLSGDERLIFKRVSAYCAKTAREARGTDESDLVGFAMQIVKKRMLSSRSALSVTVANRLEALKTRIQEDEAPSRAEVRELSGDLPLTESAHERIAQRILRGSVPRDAKRRAAEKKQLASIAGLLERVSKRPDPKIMALIDDLKRDVLPDPDEKAIIFTEYRDTLAAIREAFNNDATLAGTFAELTGGLSAKQRQLKIACFEQADTRFLLATDAASEGLNLQHRCRRIYHVELPWNPNRLEQRNGRVDRHGQKRNPIVRYLFYPDSPEDGVLSGIVRKILEMQQDRVSTPDIIGIVSAADIEALRVIDPACGSGHFLIGAARYLGRRLHAAYRREYKDDPPSPFYPDRPLTAAIREQWAREGEAWCKRRIIEKCLFGVDLNPTAVQLAQVALWIESLAGDRPLSFFAHHVRAGNSLLGTWVANLGNPVLRAAETAEQSAQLEMFTHDTDAQIARALDERLLIDAPMPPDVRPDTPGEYRYKQDRLANAENQVKKARLLFDLRNASAFIPDIRKIWWSLLRMPDPESYARGQPWWDEFVACTREQRFFHWELEFPEIFRTAGGGFDAVLGNPPWEKIKPDRKEFYGRADILIRAYTGGELDARIRELHAAHPGLQTAFDDYSATVKTLAACLKKGDDYRFCDWLIDGKSTGGDPDLFKFFVERAHRILRPGGRLGFLVPSAVYNNEGCTGMRHLILDQSRVITFYGFENRRKIFPIHSSYKFVCLTLEKRSESTMEDNLAETEFQAAFMRHDVEELAKAAPSQSDSSAATLTPACAASLGAAGRPYPSPKGRREHANAGNGMPDVQVLIRRSELERLSPGTLAFLEYRGPRDREIVLKMYGLLPGMTPSPLLGDRGPDTWNARFHNEFHMTNDRDLWTRPDGKLWTPKEICGLNYPADRSIPFAEVRAAMAKEGFWPLYEGKHIEQFLVGIRPIDRWLSIEKAEKKNGRPPASEPKLVFRDIASNTNERTCLAAVLPRNSCSGNTLATLVVRGMTPHLACSVMNSFSFDFATRLKTAGTHLNWTYVSRVAVPIVRHLENGNSFATQESDALGVQAIADHEPAYDRLWQVNRAVAEAYGLTADDFAHILTTFPVFARKRPGFHAYLRKRVAEWRSEHPASLIREENL